MDDEGQNVCVGVCDLSCGDSGQPQAGRTSASAEKGRQPTDAAGRAADTAAVQLM